MHFEAPSRFRKGCVISIQNFQSNSSYFSMQKKTNTKWIFCLKIQELVKINWWFDFTNITFCKNLKFTCVVDKGMIKHIIASRQTSSVNSIFSDQIKGVFQKHNTNVVTQSFLTDHSYIMSALLGGRGL